MKYERSEYKGPDWEAYCRTIGKDTTGAPAYKFSYEKIDYWVVYSDENWEVLNSDGTWIASGQTIQEAIEWAKFNIRTP